MADADASSPPSRAYVATAVAMIVVAFCGRAVYLTRDVGSDTAMFVYMGKLVDQGGRLGVDLVDNKLPSVGLLMSPLHRAIGAEWTGYTLIGLAMSAIATVMLARAAKRCLGKAATWPVAVAAAVWLNLPPVVFGLLQLETLQIFFCTLAAACVMDFLTRRHWADALTAGLCVGVAVWAKPTAGALLPAAGLAMLISTMPWRTRLGGIGWMTLGFAFPVVLCAWLLMITGMIDALPATLRQLKEYSANSTAELADAIKPLIVLAAALFPVAILGIVFRRDLMSKRNAGRAVTVFVVAWLMAELVGVVAQRRMYAYHFLVLGPPAALLLGLIPRKARVVSLVAAMGPVVLVSGLWTVQLYLRPDPADKMTAIIAAVQQHAAAGETVWIDDYPRLLVETDFRPGSRLPLTFLFGNSDASPGRFGQMILRDFAERRPAVIVLHDDPKRFTDFYRQNMAELAAYPRRGEAFERAYFEIDAYVRERYEQVAHMQRMNVYRRR